MYDPGSVRLLQVRYSGTQDEAVKTIEKAWSKVNPGLKADLKPVEDEIKFFYNTIFGDIVNILGAVALMAIIISCLGLLGMATYTIETRLKEISVRKVLGSSDGDLVFLLSKGFLGLLLAAVLLGTPLAWLINKQWLEMIAYHTSFNAGMILSGTGILLIIGALTIGSQTLRAAYTNPVDNLKSE